MQTNIEKRIVRNWIEGKIEKNFFLECQNTAINSLQWLYYNVMRKKILSLLISSEMWIFVIIEFSENVLICIPYFMLNSQVEIIFQFC